MIPDTIVPANPATNMAISTGVICISLEKASENADPGAFKYSIVDILSTIINTTNGYKNAINHVLRNNIFNINAIPKKMTKYNIIDTTN